MPKPKTHTGIVVREAGEKRVKLHMTATTWVAGPKEYYYRDTGQRGGGARKARLLLESIEPVQSAGSE